MHPKCFDNKYEIKEKVATLDIETSNLSATFGIVLTYCLKPLNGKTIKRSITKDDIERGLYDKLLLRNFCRDVLQFDRVITWYGKRFDIPFLRTRCVFWGLDFPVDNEILHTDAYFISKFKLKMHSNRLGVVAPFFHIAAKAHPLNPEIWFRCMRGDKKALKFVLLHNEEDVVSLEKLWIKLNKYHKLTKTSI